MKCALHSARGDETVQAVCATHPGRLWLAGYGTDSGTNYFTFTFLIIINIYLEGVGCLGSMDCVACFGKANEYST